MPLFQSDFRHGVAVLNRLLNHAARNRARSMATPRSLRPLTNDETVRMSETELEVDGADRRYVGDEHVGAGTAEPESDHIRASAHYKRWNECATN